MAQTKADILKRRPITPADHEAINEIKHAMTLRVRLHELRERRDTTQSAVAERLGTSRPNVSRIEGEDDMRLSSRSATSAHLADG